MPTDNSNSVEQSIRNTFPEQARSDAARDQRVDRIRHDANTSNMHDAADATVIPSRNGGSNGQ
jgi:hypothetical protein